MNAIKKELLRKSQKYCEREHKSTEYMLQYMQDSAGVDLDCVLSYLKKYGGFKEVKNNE